MATAVPIAIDSTAKVINDVDTSNRMIPDGPGGQPSHPSTPGGWPAPTNRTWPSAYDPDRVPPPPPPQPPPAPHPPGGGSKGRTGWPAVVAVCCTILVVAGVAAAFIRLPYDTLAPGQARRVSDLVAVEGHPVYPPEGEVLFATVSSRQSVNPYEALHGWLDSTIDVVRREVVRGDLEPDEYRRLNVEAMADSKTVAEVIALRELGFTDLGVGAEIVEVDPTLPAAGILQAEDVVVAIDGRPVSTADDAVEAIRDRKAGDTIVVGFRRGPDPDQEAEATLAEGDDGGPLLGVRLTTKIELPFEVTIDSGNVVGPSAGLAYALELLDLLSPGELTGGARVAATGDLTITGDVRPVGGVGQKAVAVRRAGAAVFLVPEENEDEARSSAGADLRVVGVSSFQEALEALATLEGSNALDLEPEVVPAA